MDRNKQEEGQTEVTYQTLSEFLQSTPPNQWRNISNLSVPRSVGSYPNWSVVAEINTPELQLHCSPDFCNGVRFFRCTNVFSSTGTYLEESNFSYTKLTPFVARGPCASQGSLDQKTSNQVNWVLFVCYLSVLQL